LFGTSYRADLAAEARAGAERAHTNVDTEIKLLSRSVVQMKRTLESMTVEYSEEERTAI
jgi:hypothetical protein